MSNKPAATEVTPYESDDSSAAGRESEARGTSMPHEEAPLDGAPETAAAQGGEALPVAEPAEVLRPPPRADFSPPAIPGMREETTRPTQHTALGAAKLDDAPRPGTGAAEGLFDDEPFPPGLDGEDPLDEKTVDFELPNLTVKHTALEEKSALSTDESATIEGAPLYDEGPSAALTPPDAGAALDASDGKGQIRLEEPLGNQRGAAFYRARLRGEEQPFTAVWSADPPPEPPWGRIPDPRVVRPRALAVLERAAVRVFERPRGNTVVDYLGDGSERLLPAMATLELGIELAEILESLHGAGQFVYDLDPSHIVIERGGRMRLYAIHGLYPEGHLPDGPPGPYAAPEVRRRLSYLIGQHSDVYAVALVVYALLAKRAPIDIYTDPALLPSPRVFRPECPLGIWPYLQPCLTPTPGKRVGHARGLKMQLEHARRRLLAEASAADEPQPVVLEAWAELHTGLGKARRGAPQQDRALSVTDEEGNVGLYLIADGVSRSRYGDGAFAAEQVEASALARWNALEKAGPAALALSHAQRADVLRQISRSAGKRIAQEVNQRYTPLANEPNQVMSTTLAAAFVVDGEATVANLGDSRAYLIRDATIERITIDHDRTTDALRMGLSFYEAAEVRMGAALTRVVGRVSIDENGGCRPDPFDPEVFRVRLLPGDRLLLCSDGVPDFAAGAGASQAEAEKRMLACVLEHEDPARAAYELVVLANRAGGYDNISCVLIAAHAG